LFVSFPEVVLGAECDVPTLSGRARLKIEPGTQPGKMLRMREKGVQHLNRHGAGDQLVRINVIVPKKINGRERELLKEMQEMPNINPKTTDEGSGFFKKFGL
jgi:molecular chaperone DnaJ